MPTVNQLPQITVPTRNDVILAEQVSSGVTGKMTISQIADIVTSIVANPPTSAGIANAGGILESNFNGLLGYVKKIGVQDFTEVCTIPSSDISGLSTLALTSTPASARTYLQFTSIGNDLVVNSSTAASARTALGFSAFGSSLVSAGTAASAATLLNLGTLATTSTAVSARNFLGFSTFGAQIVSAGTATSVNTLLNLGTLATTSTAASGRTFLGLGTLATTSTAASGISFLGLTQFATAPASITTAATSTYMMYNGTQWVPTSITSGLSPARVFKSTAIVAQGFSTSTDYIHVSLANKIFDTVSGYDTTQSRYTPPVAGYWQFTGGIAAQASVNSGLSLAVRKNNVASESQYAKMESNGVTLLADTVHYMNGTTDYVDLAIYFELATASGATINLSPYAYFYGNYLGS